MISRSFPHTLSSRIHSAIKENPDLQPLFDDITAYINNCCSNPYAGQQEPTSKKRKFEVPTQDSTQDNDVFDSITDISFSIPQRKKLRLELSRSTTTGSIRGTNHATNEPEFSIRYTAIDYCICLPVPEKAQPQYSFCVFPAQDAGDEKKQLLFTVPGTKVKPDTVESEVPALADETYKDVTIRMLNKRLRRKVIEPDPKDFTSSVSQAHRKGEKALHIKAFRGSKDGFLFLLPHGLIFAFKKPLLLLPFQSILSISYTSILQRTFNLVVNTQPPSSSSTPSNPPDASTEIEFSMLDQADFANIDAYVKRHGLHDASMAEQRRARKLNINGVKKGEDGEEWDGELEKAAREMDEEDEEEDDENFDPGSEGESEGSGERRGEEEEREGGGGVEEEEDDDDDDDDE
ncbi:MAG: hypothetical protein Q9222_004043 [Ikaeria aurantiellina]